MNKDSKENNRKCQGQNHFSHAQWPKSKLRPFHLNTGRPSGKSDIFPEKVIFIWKLVPFLNNASLLYTSVDQMGTKHAPLNRTDREANMSWASRAIHEPHSSGIQGKENNLTRFRGDWLAAGAAQYLRVPFQDAYNHSQKLREMNFLSVEGIKEIGTRDHFFSNRVVGVHTRPLASWFRDSRTC